MTAIIVSLIAHIHASHGPDGVTVWLSLPHVAAGLGFNWAGPCAGPVGWFQTKA